MTHNSSLCVQGTDPAADLYKFAEEMKFHKKLSSISLGQGQVRILKLTYTTSCVKKSACTYTCIHVCIQCHAYATLFCNMCPHPIDLSILSGFKW